MAVLLLLAFFGGALAVVAMELLGLCILIRRLNRKVDCEEIKDQATMASSSRGDPNPCLYDKEGPIWVLEPDKIPKSGIEDKLLIEPRRRKEVSEVTPVHKYAKIRDHCLILLDSDHSQVEISLKGCTVVAVSATTLSSRKWAKRYPIKLESKDAAIYKGHKIVYIYLDTSWEKESWCKALRFSSCTDEDKSAWFSNLNMEFRSYLASLNAGYPTFLKPSAGSNTGLTNKSVKLDNSSSKVRQFLKKLTKKASKSGQDHEERKICGKSPSFQDLTLDNGLGKMDATKRSPNVSVDDNGIGSTISASTGSGTISHLSGTSDGDSNHKNYDDGTLCWNMLISRLFFDAKSNIEIRSSLQNRIQRALSNMRIPSYIGEVACTSVDPGTLPPRIRAVRLVSSDMNESWACEIDVEYLGGMLLDIETRLEIQELELEGEEDRFSMNTPGEVTSELLDSFEDLGKQLRLPHETLNEIKHNAEGFRNQGEAENAKSTSYASTQGSRWKSMLHSITKQVSQIPLSLRIRISSLSGTLWVCIKPPPSDQLWVGFTSMPEIQFNLDSFVGDHKITSAHLALFLISRFKASIRETLVLPNSESVCIPWMLAQKEDWVPRKVAPFVWYRNNQDSASSTTKQVVSSFELAEARQTIEGNHVNPPIPEISHEKAKSAGGIYQTPRETLNLSGLSKSSMDDSTLGDRSFQELTAPLLKKDTTQESGSVSREEKSDLYASSKDLMESTNQNVEDDDMRPRRIGTKERMRGLGKKMGEKLEVKRRHFEEKGRSFVERMRGP